MTTESTSEVNVEVLSNEKIEDLTVTQEACDLIEKETGFAARDLLKHLKEGTLGSLKYQVSLAKRLILAERKYQEDVFGPAGYVNWKHRAEKAEEKVKDHEEHIKYSYKALGNVNKSLYIFDHIYTLKKNLDTMLKLEVEHNRARVKLTHERDQAEFKLDVAVDLLKQVEKITFNHVGYDILMEGPKPYLKITSTLAKSLSDLNLRINRSGLLEGDKVKEPKDVTPVVGDQRKCPKCKTGVNSPELGGTDKCFHCNTCGYINCGDYPRPLQAESLTEVINKALTSLPKGWLLMLQLENSSGFWTLDPPTGERIDPKEYTREDKTMVQQGKDAIAYAISKDGNQAMYRKNLVATAELLRFEETMKVLAEHFTEYDINIEKR